MHFLYNIGIRLMQGYVAVAALFSAKLRARHRGDAQAFDALERCCGERCGFMQHRWASSNRHAR